MTERGVTKHTVEDGDAGRRLDRWFRQRFPELAHGRLQKLLRSGQVRVDGGRAKGSLRLAAGQTIRVPPLGGGRPHAAKSAPPVAAADAAELRARVLYRDDELIAIDKPPGLAVQGGSRTARHLDAMLEALRFEADERPRLVHRLDKDTSGVLLLARHGAAARRLTALFRRQETRKLYWAVVVGQPKPVAGRIDMALAKQPGRRGEQVVPDVEGRRATTLYSTLEHAGRRAAWLALQPLTGRTHQLRVHLAELGTPILGDGKYGGQQAFIEGLSRRLHLHARELALPEADGLPSLRAELPPHMAETFEFFGFDPSDESDPFATED
ncbi:MAG: RluA family pseudouridine synthase [Alphaproteobacteria bacterium]|jgi:23S rRNA pseudouridine955/2504/2580 synthase|nr:RNA pseudouridine synthase [Rhodospirillaceae bacterium]MDP6405094.1 RluA family pseudouridine synthase [Alphaproteobacteria bacterium]MDP6621550.1 RluA family pseudouridine synthase [Alphaproteobacteria bacterium]|tara:strand:- start:943 stop:1917 length:975 start_codon:yes stop_codon:yes gene_type:complete